MIFYNDNLGSFDESFVTNISENNDQRNYMTFNNFAAVAHYCSGPVALMKLYAENKVEWPDESYKFMIQPNSIVKTKIASCFDSAIFGRTFCNLKNIENNIIIISAINRKTKELVTGHAAMVYKGDKIKEWFIWNYECAGYGAIYGPFKTLKEAALDFSGYYLTIHSNMLSSYKYDLYPKQKLASALDEDELKIVDDFVKSKKNNIIQNDFTKKLHTVIDLNNELIKSVSEITTNESSIISKSMFKQIKRKLLFNFIKNSKSFALNALKMAEKDNKVCYVFDASKNIKDIYEF